MVYGRTKRILTQYMNVMPWHVSLLNSYDFRQFQLASSLQGSHSAYLMELPSPHNVSSCTWVAKNSCLAYSPEDVWDSINRETRHRKDSGMPFVCFVSSAKKMVLLLERSENVCTVKCRTVLCAFYWFVDFRIAILMFSSNGGYAHYRTCSSLLQKRFLAA